jgi:hypothetical protein
LSEETSARLEARSRSVGQTKSALVQRYVEEGMRMDDHPGIFFQEGPTGRRAKLLGGPDVWEVINVWRDTEGSQEERIHETGQGMGLHPRFVREALNYYVDFQEEIDERIRRNDEASERGYAEWLRRQAVLSR